MYLPLKLYLKCSCKLSLNLLSSYFVNLTSLSNDDDNKLKLSLNSSLFHENVINFSLFCAITDMLSFFVFNFSRLEIIR